MEVVALVILFLIALGLAPFVGGVIKLLIMMLFWMIAGNVAGHIIRGEDYGVIGNITLGLLGGIVGTILMHIAGLGSVAGIPIIGGIIAGILGAVVFVFLMRLTLDKNFGK